MLTYETLTPWILEDNSLLNKGNKENKENK